MGEKVTIQQYYSIMGVKKIIYIEDGVRLKPEISSRVYDFLTLHEDKKNEFIDKIADSTVKSCFLELSNSFRNSEDLDAIRPDMMEDSLKELGKDYLLECYKTIEKQFSDELATLMLRLGIGINPKSVFFKDLLFVEQENEGPIPIRIITGWKSDDIALFDSEVEELAGQDDASYICIIDDMIGEEHMASKIVSYIRERISNKGDTGICIVLTSHKDVLIEESPEEAYVEVIHKGIDEQSEAIKALLKNCYSLLVNSYKAAKIKAIKSACSVSSDNVNAAIYIANMARYEGITGYESIRNWIDTQEEFEFEKNFRGIKKMTELSWAISNSEIDDSSNYEPNPDRELACFLGFDKSINQKSASIQAGDIFNIKEKYYVLVGQECDFMLRNNGRRKAKLGKLLSAEVTKGEYKPKASVNNTGRKVIIDNFDNGESLTVNCDEACYVDLGLLDLCSYDENGIARMKMGVSTGHIERLLLTEGQVARGKEIFDKIKELANHKSDEIEWYKQLCLSENIISYLDYAIDGEYISYPIKRVARTKRYSQLLYKLNLEHDERLALESINVDRTEEVKIELEISGIKKTDVPVFVQMTTDEKDKTKLANLNWYIDCSEMDKELKAAGIDIGLLEKRGNYYLFESRGDNKKNFGDNKYMWKKTYGKTDHRLSIEVL